MDHLRLLDSCVEFATSGLGGLLPMTWYPATMKRTKYPSTGTLSKELATRACFVYKVRWGRLNLKSFPNEAFIIRPSSQYDRFRLPTYGTPSRHRTYGSIRKRGSQPRAQRLT